MVKPSDKNTLHYNDDNYSCHSTFGCMFSYLGVDILRLPRLPLSPVRVRTIKYKVQLNHGICILQVCVVVLTLVHKPPTILLSSSTGLMNTLKKMQLRGTFIFKGTKGECSAVWPHYYPLRRTQEKLNWSYNLWFQVITDSQSEIHSHLQCHSVSIQVRMLWTKWTDVREQNRPAGTHHSPPSLSQNHTLTASNHYPQ